VEQNRKMFKVVSPLDRQDGSTYWMRCGSAFINKDNSINVFVHALPLAQIGLKDGMKLQLRELTDEELRERAERRTSYRARGTVAAPPVTGGVDATGVPF
jgi:hypothetical protein